MLKIHIVTQIVKLGMAYACTHAALQCECQQCPQPSTLSLDGADLATHFNAKYLSFEEALILWHSAAVESVKQQHVRANNMRQPPVADSVTRRAKHILSSSLSLAMMCLGQSSHQQGYSIGHVR